MSRDSAQVRQIELPDRDLLYTLKRSHRRKTIGLKVSEDGLTVTLPARVSVAEADAVVREKAGWVIDRLEKRQARTAPREAEPKERDRGPCSDSADRRAGAKPDVGGAPVVRSHAVICTRLSEECDELLALRLCGRGDREPRLRVEAEEAFAWREESRDGWQLESEIARKLGHRRQLDCPPLLHPLASGLDGGGGETRRRRRDATEREVRGAPRTVEPRAQVEAEGPQARAQLGLRGPWQTDPPAFKALTELGAPLVKALRRRLAPEPLGGLHELVEGTPVARLPPTAASLRATARATGLPAWRRPSPPLAEPVIFWIVGGFTRARAVLNGRRAEE